MPIINSAIQEAFQKNLLIMGLNLNPKAQSTLVSYLELLAKWNRSYNLTAITDPAQMLSHHLLDSLSLAPFIQGPRILDVGTGAGFPGIPLAVAFPDYEFVLLDSNGKKLRFITQAISELAIPNVKLVQTRVESFHDNLGFSDIIARAVSSLKFFVNSTQQLLAPGGQWLAMKGAYPTAELEEIQQSTRVEKPTVPGLEAERHVVIIGV